MLHRFLNWVDVQIKMTSQRVFSDIVQGSFTPGGPAERMRIPCFVSEISFNTAEGKILVL